VLAGAKGCDRNWAVKVVGYRDTDGIDVGISEEFRVIAVQVRDAVGSDKLLATRTIKP
jgi:hypothetical protein